MSKRQETKRTWRMVSLLFVFSCLVITIVSKSSFLYYINDGSEVNQLYTLAEGWKNGQIPYKDLFGSSGPMLYFFYVIVSFIGPATSYMGLYLLEIISLFITLCLFYKVSTSYFSAYKSLWTTFLFASVLMISPFFGKGGNVEELMMPCLFLPILLIQKFSYKKIRDMKEYFQLGLLSGSAMGIIFWSYYSLIGGWIGFILCLLLLFISQKQLKQFISYISGVLLSFGALSFLLVGYFMWKDGLGSLKNNYFLFNYHLYIKGDVGWTRSILQAIHNVSRVFSQNPLLFLFFISGLFIVLNSKHIFCSISSKCLYFTSFLLMGIGISFGENGSNHAYLTLFSYSSVWVLCLCATNFSVPKRTRDRRVKTGLIASLSFFILFGINQNLSESKLYPGNRTIFVAQKEKQSSEIMPMQDLFASLIRKENNPTLLMYGMPDIGIFKKAEIYPNNKYFMRPMISYQEYPEMMEEQNQLINNKEITFIVLQRNGENVTLKNIPKNIKKNYQLIDQKSQYDDRMRTYFLFKVNKDA